MVRRAGARLFLTLSSSPAEIECDSEKVRSCHYASSLEPDDDESHSFSDSSSSPTYPILGHPMSKRMPRFQLYRLPNSVTRWLCLALLSSLLLFISCLFRLSLFSSALAPTEIPLSKTKVPSKPPQWESFPFLQRFYGGRKTLVFRKDNMPEYPDSGSVDHIDNPESEANDTQSRSYLNATSSVFHPYPDYISKEYTEK